VNHRSLLGAIGAHTLFWGWNLLLLSTVWFGFGPVIVLEMVIATFRGFLPPVFLLCSLVVIGIPTLSVLVAGLTSIRRHPGHLLSLLYGVQIPVMMLLLVRLFAIHELVASNALALVIVVGGAMGLTRTLLHGPREERSGIAAAQLGLATGYLVVGLWWVALATTVLLPAVGHMLWGAATMLSGLLSLRWLPTSAHDLAGGIMGLVYASPFLLFFAVTTVMFLVLPFASFGATARNWQLVHRAARLRWGPVATGGSAALGVALVGLFTWLAPQPQGETLDRLAAIETDAERLAAIEDLAHIRQGLLAAKLGHDRFLDAGDSTWVVDLWQDFVGQELAQVPAGFVDALLAPLTYDRWSSASSGWGNPDAWHAERAYAEVFDAPMAIAERDALLRSATYTWSWQDVEAGLLDVGQQRVRLAEQHVEVERAGDLATVRIHDVWRNQTWAREEILLAFSLPETAAVTGLWLGSSDDRSEAFPYVVAPRGAAQEVYESEVRRRVDPALLEQVGPRQYRLRAFPVEPRTDAADDVWTAGAEGPPLHVWTEIVVAADADGRFPLPALAEARNAFWDDRTTRTLDGESVTVDDWVPASVDGATARTSHEAIVGGKRVRATPAVATAGSSGLLLDVLIDSSASMRDHSDAIDEAIATLSAAHDVEVFCTREQLVRPCDRDWKDIVFWGPASPAEQIVQWSSLDRSPDALVVLTDGGSYALIGRGRAQGTSVEGSLPDVEVPPLWLVHHGTFPAAYPDWTLDRITRSGGGVTADVHTLLDRLDDPTVRDGWRFEVTDAPVGAVASSGPFAAIAARAAIARIAGTGDGALEQLDTLHGLAKEHHVVTAWSSMIVLVNDAQRERLKKLSEAEDRFEREAIDGELQDVSAVPEPSTWLLLALGGGLLWRRSRRPDA
jgi:putative PEP-CTERM system integral membrane protein